MALTTKAKFAPSFDIDVIKNFKWWEAEMDRAVWERDQLTQEELRTIEERSRKIESMGGLMYWTTSQRHMPYIQRTVWKSKSTTLQK